MKQIENFNVPENWGDVTITNLLRASEIEDTSMLSLIKLIKVFNPDKDPMELSVDKVVRISREIYSLLTQPPAQTEERDGYSVDGIRYKLATPETIDFQQFIDVNALHSSEYTDQLKNMSLIISLLTENRPNGAKEWAAVVSDNVSVETGTGLLLFFSTGLESYIKDTQPSLMKGQATPRKSETR